MFTWKKEWFIDIHHQVYECATYHGVLFVCQAQPRWLPNRRKFVGKRRRAFEFAAFSRDLEKDLSIPITTYNQETTDWNRVSSLDSFQYYDRIERLINQYSTPKIDESLRLEFKDLHDVIMRPVIRQEMISKILGEDEQQG